MRTQSKKTRKTTAKSRPRRWQKWLCRLGIFSLIIALLAGAAAGGALFYFSHDLPPIHGTLAGYDPPQITRILTADGVLIGEIFEERRTVVPLDDIPEVMRNAVIAAEDANFHTHKGLDYLGILRAVFKNIEHGRMHQGASTITQQVASTFFLSREKTFARKMREMLLTRHIEERLSKDQILFLYLNQINFGHARYGVGEAARFYFAKDIADISLAEAALLAAIPKGPAIYEPIGHPDNALGRRAYVLKEMHRKGFISAEAAQEARDTALQIRRDARPKTELAPEIVALATEAARELVSIEKLRHGGYTIETTVSASLQEAARKALKDGLVEVDARNQRIAPFRKRAWPKDADRGLKTLVPGRIYTAEVTATDDETGELIVRLGAREGRIRIAKETRYNPKQLPASKMAEIGAKVRVHLEQAPPADDPIPLRLSVGPQGAAVVMSPGTGDILAMVGGDEMPPGGFNRATRSLRQPGSAFKPLVYLEALRTRRYHAATLLDDSPEVEGSWQPGNASQAPLKGLVPLRQALAESLNLPVIKVIRDIQPESVTALAARMGIASPLEPVPSLALGASGLTPLELTQAYAVLAAAGRHTPHRVLLRIVAPDGRAIPIPRSEGEPVIAPQEAWMTTSLLRSVVEARTGTGKKAAEIKRPCAGKTGTTNNAVDAWFAGYTPDRVATVWVGFDDPRSLGRKEYGGKAALPIWVAMMRAAHQGLPVRDFDVPEGIITVRIDPQSGLRAWDDMPGAIDEFFIEGSEPIETALPDEVLAPEDFLLDQAALEEEAEMRDTAADDAPPPSASANPVPPPAASQPATAAPDSAPPPPQQKVDIPQ